MTMKNNCIRLVDGKLKYFPYGWPEKPESEFYIYGEKSSVMIKYDESCQSALASAVDVMNVEAVMLEIDKAYPAMNIPTIEIKPDTSYFIGGTFEVRLKPQSDSDIWDVPGIVPNPVPPKQKNLAYWTEAEIEKVMEPKSEGEKTFAEYLESPSGMKYIKWFFGEDEDGKAMWAKALEIARKEVSTNTVQDAGMYDLSWKPI